MNSEMSSALRRIADGLEKVTEGFRSLADAVGSVDVSMVDRCGAIRSYGAYANDPCIRAPGHTGYHIDRDGDEF